MADPESKYTDNADGKYYVDEECIDCDLCREVAPTIYQRNNEEGYSFVVKSSLKGRKRKPSQKRL